MSSSIAVTIVTTVGYPSDMTFRRLGDSGLVVSVVGLGTNNFGMKLGSSAELSGTAAAADVNIEPALKTNDVGIAFGGGVESAGGASFRVLN